MTVRGTLALAVILVVLIAYLRLTAPAPGEPAAAALLPGLERASVIEVVRGGTVTRLVRGDQAWSEARAEDFLDALRSIPVLTVIDDSPGDPAAYGFGPDALRLRVAAGGTPLGAIDVGAVNPAQTGVYVRRVGEPSVLLVGALLRWELEKIRRVFPATVPP
jgi:hypothetical protein